MAGTEGIRAGRTYVEIGATDTALSRVLSAAEKKLKAFGGAVQAMGASFAKFGGVAAAPFVASGKAFSTYEDALASLRAAANLTAEEFQAVNAAATEISAISGTGLSKVARAMTELLKAGLPLESVLGDATQAAIEFARVSDLDVATAAITLTDAMNVFKVDATTAVDTLSKAADASSISVQQVTESFSQVSAVAKMAGMSIAGTAKAIAILGQNGIKGSDAGTSLKTMLLRLLAPTEEASDVIKILGLNIRDARGKMKNFRGIIAELEKTVGKLGPAERDLALETLFGADAFRAASVFLLTGTKGLDEFTGKMNESLPVADKYAIIMDTISGAVERLMTTLEVLGVSIGAALVPLIREWGQNLTVATAALQIMIVRNQDLVVSVAKGVVAVSAFGAAMIATGLAIKAVGSAIGLVSSTVRVATVAVYAYNAAWRVLAASIKIASVAQATFASLSAVIAAIASPAGITAIALAGLAYWLLKTEKGGRVLASLGKQFTILKAEVTTSFAAIAEALKAGDMASASKVLWALIKLEWVKGVVALKALWGQLVDYVLTATSTAATAVVSVWAGSVAKVRSLWTESSTFITESWAVTVAAIQNSWSSLVTGLTTRWNTFTGFFSASIAALGAMFQGWIAITKAVATGAFVNLKGQWSAFTTALNMGIQGLRSQWTLMTTLLRIEWKALVEYVKSQFTIISRFGELAFEGIKNQVGGLIILIRTAFFYLGKLFEAAAKPFGIQAGIDAFVKKMDQVAADNKKIANDAEKARKAREAALAAQILGAEAGEKAELARIEAVRAAAVKAAQDRGAAGQAARQQAAEKGLPAGMQDIAQAQAELMKARIDAKLAGLKPEGLDEAEAMKARIDAKLADLDKQGVTPEGVGQGLAQAKTKVDVAGTFNAAALRGLGAGNVADEQLKEQKKTNAELNKLNDRAKAGRLVFQP